MRFDFTVDETPKHDFRSVPKDLNNSYLLVYMFK